MASAARPCALCKEALASKVPLLLRLSAQRRQQMASAAGAQYRSRPVLVKEFRETELGSNFSCARAARFRPVCEFGELFLNVCTPYG